MLQYKKTYKGLIKDTFTYNDIYDGELITVLTPYTELTIKSKYYNGEFMGYNVYANGELLETFESVKHAKLFIKSLSIGKLEAKRFMLYVLDKVS